METQKLIQDLKLIAKTDIALKYPGMEIGEHPCWQAAEKIKELDRMLTKTKNLFWERYEGEQHEN